MAAIFAPPKPPPVPEIADPEIEEEKRRQLAARQATGGHRATNILGGLGGGTPSANLLGAASQLTGGL